jgi:hypothetical protein
MIRTPIAAGPSRQYEQSRPQTLPTTADDVIRNLPDQLDVGLQTAANHVIDRPQVVGYECTYGVDGHNEKKAVMITAVPKAQLRVIRSLRQLMTNLNP